MLVLPDSITHSNALACLSSLKQAIAGESTASILIDAAPLSRFDSAALAVLLELRRCALQMGRSFALQSMPPRLADLARLYGIAELLPPKNQA
jgi:phospholipid transport system transporter-binding protein